MEIANRMVDVLKVFLDFLAGSAEQEVYKATLT